MATPTGSTVPRLSSWVKNIPQDVQTRILRYIPLQNLRDTALVCRSWTNASQRLILEKISLKVDNYSETTNVRPDLLLRSLRASPHLASYILHISIDLPMGGPISPGSPPSTVYPASFAAITSILPLLKNTKTLELNSYGPFPFPMVASIGKLVGTARLENIHLRGMSFASSNDFSMLFPPQLSLKHLQLCMMEIPHDTSPIVPPTAAYKIASLNLVSFSNFDSRCATWFSSFPVPISVTTLRLSVNGSYPDSTVALLRSLAHCLVDVELLLMRKQGQKDLPAAPILFRNLRFLKYKILVVSSIKLDHTGLLTNLKAPNLEEISVRFNLPASIKPAKCVNFPGVDNHLNHPGNFPRLRTFELDLSVTLFSETQATGRRHVDTVLAALEPQFPNMIANGFWKTSVEISDMVPH
ncbi:hypothetical protein C8R44DRAFT_822707 [Mycena epipterygia]|nr:hypothetical protein C8R44DRAFT_822707 [Mycena epipterygia]